MSVGRPLMAGQKLSRPARDSIALGREDMIACNKAARRRFDSDQNEFFTPLLAVVDDLIQQVVDSRFWPEADVNYRSSCLTALEGTATLLAATIAFPKHYGAT